MQEQHHAGARVGPQGGDDMHEEHAVHERSGGVPALPECPKQPNPFYVWKYNMTEHLKKVHRASTSQELEAEFTVSPEEKSRVKEVGKRAGKKRAGMAATAAARGRR